MEYVIIVDFVVKSMLNYRLVLKMCKLVHVLKAHSIKLISINNVQHRNLRCAIFLSFFLKSNDPAMKSSQAVTKLLPLMIGYFALSVPSGLSLYWWVWFSVFFVRGQLSTCFSSQFESAFAGWPTTFWARHSKYGFKNMVVLRIQWRNSLIWSLRKIKHKKLRSLFQSH